MPLTSISEFGDVSNLQYTNLNDSAIQLANAEITTFVDSKMLYVPLISQSGTNLCWAAAASSVGQYKTGTYTSPYAIADYFNIGYYDGVPSMSYVQSALLAFYNIHSTTNYAPALYYDAKNAINANNPIISRMGMGYAYRSEYASNFTHAVVVCGYTSSTVTFMSSDGYGTGNGEYITSTYSNTYPLQYSVYVQGTGQTLLYTSEEFVTLN